MHDQGHVMTLRLVSLTTLGAESSFFNSSALGTYLLVAALLMITFSLMSRLRKRRRGSVTEPTQLENVERMRQLRGMRGDLEDLMVEIEQLAKRLGAQLDAKSVQIEQLLAEAEQKIAQLNSLRANSVASNNNNTGQRDPGDIPGAGAGAIPDDPLARSVYELADQGNDSAQIARELDEHVGKVELILALRNV
jgi:hypothetical protein